MLLIKQLIEAPLQAELDNHLKNTDNDAEAIFDTVSRPNTRTIAIKTTHSKIFNLRQDAVKRRTAKVNQVSRLLSERDIVIDQGIHEVRKHLQAYWNMQKIH